MYLFNLFFGSWIETFFLTLVFLWNLCPSAHVFFFSAQGPIGLGGGDPPFHGLQLLPMTFSLNLFILDETGMMGDTVELPSKNCAEVP